jgi:hypothetical protein
MKHDVILKRDNDGYITLIIDGKIITDKNNIGWEFLKKCF